MIKKWCFFMFLFFLAFSLVDALSMERIYDGFVYSDQEITAGGENFSFIFKFPFDKIVVDIPTEYRDIIVKNECETKDFYHVCYEYENFSYLDEKTDEHVYMARVKIYSLIADLSFDRTASEQELYFGEKTTISVDIENVGSRKATDVLYKEEIPDAFSIVKVSDCKIDGNLVVWEGNLNNNEKVSFTYVLQAKKEIDYSSVGELKYFTGVKNISVKRKLEMEVFEPRLKIESNLNKKRVRVGNILMLNISLTNIDEDKKIIVKEFKLEIPEGLRVINSSENLKNNKLLYWKGSLRPDNESKNFILNFLPTTTGTYEFNPQYTFYLDQIFKTNEQKIPFEVYAKNLSLEANVDSAIITVPNKTNLTIQLKNLYENVTFENVTIMIMTSFMNFTKNIPIIPPLEKRVITQTIDFPKYLDKDEKIKIITKNNWYDEIFKNEKKINVKIIPLNLETNKSNKSNYIDNNNNNKSKVLIQKENLNVNEPLKLGFKTKITLISLGVEIILILMVFWILKKWK